MNTRPCKATQLLLSPFRARGDRQTIRGLSISVLLRFCFFAEIQSDVGEGSTRVLPGSLRLLHLQGGGGDPGGEGGGFVEFLFKQLLILHGKYLASIINHQHMYDPPPSCSTN